MRNPAKRRKISLVVAAVSVTALVYTASLREQYTPLNDVWFGCLIASIFSTIFSFVAVITFQVHVGWQNQLKRGHKLLGRWTLAQDEWQQFIENEKPRLAVGRSNSIKSRAISGAGGVEVIVAQHAVMVADDVYSLGAYRGVQWLPEQPPCFEYNMVTSTKSGKVHWNIRFPVAAGADVQARAVWDYMDRRAKASAPVAKVP